MLRQKTEIQKYPYNKKKDKAVMFFSAGSPGDCELIMDMGINDILVSYFYLRKRKREFEEVILPRIKENGGLFMTDSGGFSFIEGLTLEQAGESEKEEYWLEYLEEYVAWLKEWKDYIFVAANLDLDKVVSREAVNKWNKKYFEPLEKDLNIVYVAHKDPEGVYADKTGLKRLREYCNKYDYVGVNQGFKDQTGFVYEIARNTKTRIHGFAWTSIPLLKVHPHFSVDSTTWLGGVRYGTTYRYDGANAKVLDYKKKNRSRMPTKNFCKINKINFAKVLADDRVEINRYNLLGWLGFRWEYLKAANLKLKNRNASFYERRTD